MSCAYPLSECDCLTSLSSAIASGWLLDTFCLYMARRNGGVSEPEHKLWLLVPMIFVLPLGLCLLALGPYFNAHWIVFVLGMSVINAAGPIGTIVSLNYVFDCYHGLAVGDSIGMNAAPYVIAIMVPSGLMSFGFVGLECLPRVFQRLTDGFHLRTTPSHHGFLLSVPRTFASPQSP